MAFEMAVIESRWWDEFNSNSKSLFDTLFEVEYDNPHAYLYERFMGRQSFDEIVTHVARQRGIDVVYIACHGAPASLHCGNGDEISRTLLRNDVVRMADERGAKLRGLYLASCSFTNIANAEFILCDADHSLAWIAGYEGEADWMSSAALDLLFFQHYLQQPTNLSHLNRARSTCRYIRDHCGGLADQLQFRVFSKKPGRPNDGGPRVRNLMELEA